ncbi:MAG: hypothetical protein JNL04_18795 [Rhodospirillaceae bacterium]|nr:hypothetical protein [Rhodospirillaceae bacterium]
MQIRKARRDRTPPRGGRRAPSTGTGIDADDRKSTDDVGDSLTLMRAVEHPGEFPPPTSPKADKGRHQD